MHCAYRCWPLQQRDFRGFRRKPLLIARNCWSRSQNTRLPKTARYILYIRNIYILHTTYHSSCIITTNYYFMIKHCCMHKLKLKVNCFANYIPSAGNNNMHAWYAADMDSWEMDHTKRAKLCTLWSSFPPVCSSSNLALQKRLHLWWSCSHETTRWC